MSPDDPRHGTVRGRSAHQRAGVPVCDPCRAAVARYEKVRKYERSQGKEYLVPVWRAKRRVHSLQALGWTQSHVTDALGWPSPRYLQARLNGQWVSVRTLGEIDRVFRKLSMKPGPSNITRMRALAAGHAPPLAWDDIDDENATPIGVAAPHSTGCGSRAGYDRHYRNGETPCEPCRAAANKDQAARRATRRADPTRKRLDDYDEAAVQRRVSGDKRVPLSRRERREVVSRLHALDRSTTSIADTAGLHRDQVLRDLSALGLTPNVYRTNENGRAA